MTKVTKAMIGDTEYGHNAHGKSRIRSDSLIIKSQNPMGKLFSLLIVNFAKFRISGTKKIRSGNNPDRMVD